ncbi:MAG: metallophosphoesterase family protein [Paludibacteraceae bacterium]|nr:metallophosphoesterase family protein [Paludibacteraceae bacterium]
MTRIGLLSDTHGLLDKRVFEHFRDVDEIWHAGDIGSIEVLQALREFKPTRAVFGNMDSGDVRWSLSEFYRFRVEDVNVLLTHIGGYPGKYNPWLLPWFKKSLEAKLQTERKTQQPSANDIIDLFVCGHSHILKVQYDKYYRFLTMNPGAAGKQGWQPCQTVLRFTIDGQKIDNLEVIEMERQ